MPMVSDPEPVARTVPDSSLSGPRETENFNNSDSSFSDPVRRPVLSDTSDSDKDCSGIIKKS